MRKLQVTLTDDERNLLRSLLRCQSQPARTLRRCHMLLHAERGETDRAIAEQLGCSDRCVADLRRRFAAGGIHRALYDAPRSGAPRRFTAAQLQRIVEMTAGPPPEGSERWTIQLICDTAVARGIVDRISVGRVCKLLEESDQPPRRSNDSRSGLAG